MNERPVVIGRADEAFVFGVGHRVNAELVLVELHLVLGPLVRAASLRVHGEPAGRNPHRLRQQRVR